jgi:hypothetical protein
MTKSLPRVSSGDRAILPEAISNQNLCENRRLKTKMLLNFVKYFGRSALPQFPNFIYV